jgi:hypothetical protein
MAVRFGKLLMTKPSFPRKTAMHQECILFYRSIGFVRRLKQKGFRDDPQARMTTTEVLMTALVAAWFFGNNLRFARQALQPSLAQDNRNRLASHPDPAARAESTGHL